MINLIVQYFKIKYDNKNAWACGGAAGRTRQAQAGGHR